MGRVTALEDARHPCCPSCSRRARYARDVADRLGLRDWRVEVAHEPTAEGEVATVDMARERKLARLRFCEDFDDLTPAERRHAFVHELVHPILRDLWETAREGAAEEFGGAALRVYLASVRRELERAVDVLATVVAAGLPEPEW